jgi:hypothetical protein
MGLFRRTFNAVRSATGWALEQTAEVMDRTRETINGEEITMADLKPDELVPGSWGGDARGFDKVGDTLAQGYRQGQAAQVEQIATAEKQREAINRLQVAAADGDEVAEAKLERIAEIARERAHAAAARPKPKYIKPQSRESTVDLVGAWAEEGVRNQAIAKQKDVQTDAATAARIAGQTPGLSKVIPVNEPGAPGQQQTPPGLQQPVQTQPLQSQPAQPSRLALKRRPPEFQAGNLLLSITTVREHVEAGSLDVGVMLDLAEAAAELSYALATELKGRAS